MHVCICLSGCGPDKKAAGAEHEDVDSVQFTVSSLKAFPSPTFAT